MACNEKKGGHVVKIVFTELLLVYDYTATENWAIKIIICCIFYIVTDNNACNGRVKYSKLTWKLFVDSKELT